MKTERYCGSANRVTPAAVAVCILALTLACDAAAQKWPEKTVRIVTPFGPGGGTDIFSRILAQRFTETYRPAVHRREPAGRGLDARDRVRREVAG